MARHSISKQKGKLLAVIGDEDTCVGFLLGGIGEVNEQRKRNIFVVNPTTTDSEIDEAFKDFYKRKDIDIILITQPVADRIRKTVDTCTKAIPAILEIPSKDQPYDPSKDSILKRAKGMFNLESS